MILSRVARSARAGHRSCIASDVTPQGRIVGPMLRPRGEPSPDEMSAAGTLGRVPMAALELWPQEEKRR
jgi:hypothetical protein